MWLCCILIAVAALLLLLLFSPVRLEIDTENEVYLIRYGVFVSGSLAVIDERPAVKLRCLGFTWQRKIEDLLLRLRKTVTPRVPAVRKRRSGNRRSFKWRKALAALRAIDIRKMYVDLDTGNYIRNAWLFPIFFMADKGARKLRINFNGETIVHISMQAVPAKLLWAFLKG